MALSNAIQFRMAYAIPGALTRGAGAATVKQEIFGATAFNSYGIPCKLSSGTVIPLALVGDVAPYGFLLRPFPTQDSAWPNDPGGSATPPTSGIANIMVRGYVGVFVQAGASSVAEGSAVYVRYANGSTSTPVGGIEGVFTSGTNVALTGPGYAPYFTGPADANGYAEVAFNI